MIEIDERYDTLYEQWDIAGQPMDSFPTFIFAEYEKTLAEVKRLREENERLRDMVEKAVGYGAYDEEYRGEE